MPNHKRDRRSLFFGERQELRRKLAHGIPIECPSVSDPDAIEHNEQEQRVFERLSQCFSLFDQQMRALYGRFGFRCGLSFDVKDRRDERHLKFDLLTTQCGCAGQRRDLVEGARELYNCFPQHGTLQRPLRRSAPQGGSFSISPASLQ